MELSGHTIFIVVAIENYFNQLTPPAKECNKPVGLGRATFFMVRVGFRAWDFGPGRARATRSVPRVDFGL